MYKKLFIFPYKMPFVLLLAVFSGIISILISPPLNLYVLEFFMFIPGFFLFHPENKSLKYRHFFLYGWVLGFMLVAGNFYWVTSTIKLFSALPLYSAFLLFLGYCCYIATKCGLIFLIPAVLRKRYNYPLLIASLLGFFFLEMCFPEEFPFYFGNAQLHHTYFIQIADIIGVAGITLLVVTINYLLYKFIITKQRKMLSIILIIFFITYSYSFLRLIEILSLKHVKHEYTKIKVAIVQPNEPFTTVSSEIETYMNGIKVMTNGIVNTKDLDLIVWPESAIPLDLNTPLTSYAKDFSNYVKNLPVALIYNAPASVTNPENGETKFYSNAILHIPGKEDQNYSKIMLLPFGEFLPFESTFPVLRTWLPTSGDFTKGTEIKNFKFNNEINISPQICYEITLPYFTRQFVAKKSNLIVNLTNDKWFGKTKASSLHMWEAAFRAIENRVPIIRGTNSGISAIIDINGQIISNTTELMTKTVMIATVPIYLKISSFFSLFGDTPLMVLMVYLGISAFFWKGVKKPLLIHAFIRKKRV